MTPFTAIFTLLQWSGTEPAIALRYDCCYIAYVKVTLFSLADYGSVFWTDLYIICELHVSAPWIS